MLGSGHKREIFQPIIETVAVDVMDDAPFGNRPVGFFPNKAVCSALFATCAVADCCSFVSIGDVRSAAPTRAINTDFEFVPTRVAPQTITKLSAVSAWGAEVFDSPSPLGSAMVFPISHKPKYSTNEVFGLAASRHWQIPSVIPRPLIRATTAHASLVNRHPARGRELGNFHAN